MSILKNFINSFLFWGAWIVIPLIMEVGPSLGSVLILIKQCFLRAVTPKPALYPEISIIVPVYNSSETLEACIRSINDSDYANDRIRVFLVNNQGKDDSFHVFTHCQELFPDLPMQWLNAKQGKSRALNLALYNSEGKYIVHIDSDGVLEPSALRYMVEKFEQDPTVNCMTGTIMTNPDMIQNYPRGLSRLLRKLEFMEYAQAFLAGRNYASDMNSIYTISGAFSAFRKSAILSSRMYNTDTICEDTQITFQMRYLQKEKIKISERSIFYVDPIENVDKLYTQRQRWQRGSLEVSRMFMNEDELKASKLLRDVNVRTLMYDHTFAFPRMIWYLALFCLMFVGYSGKTVLLATVFLFAIYTICGYLYFFSIRSFLRDFPDLRRYYTRQWYVIPLLPFFNLIVFFIRLAGIINSIGTDSSWRTRTLSEEGRDLRQIVSADLEKPRTWAKNLDSLFNGDPEVMYAPRTPEQKLRGSFWRYALAVSLGLLGTVIFSMVHWGSTHLTTSLVELVNTLPGSLGAMAGAALPACLPPIGLFLAVTILFLALDRRRTRQALTLLEGPVREQAGKRVLAWRQAGMICVCLLLVSSLVYGSIRYDVAGYFASLLSQLNLPQ